MTRLRAARPGDIPAMAKILQDWLDGTDWLPDLYSLEETHGFLRHLFDNHEITVAEGETVLGFLCLNGDEIPALYISAANRRAGIGKLLIDAAKQARSHLSLWTFQANSGAQAFYSRHGFREVERTDGARNDEKLPDIRLEWSRA